MEARYSETIIAQATPPGRGGVSILRISGADAKRIAISIVGSLPKPRYCSYRQFTDPAGQVIDVGLVIYFQAPQSFTGEDIVELHTHGSPIIIDVLLQTALFYGARLANPGEFTERAFRNDKIDLTQAEAIADLIDSQSRQAAQSAVRSLQGDFSKKIEELVEKLIAIRVFVEAAIDFPEEEIDFLSDNHITHDMENVLNQLNKITKIATQGSLLREGVTVVLVGQPNVGKSSLLNRLSGKESAIVTDIPGTTRDVLRENILIDGIPIHVIDTAGLRTSNDIIEQEGIRRTWEQIRLADYILVIVDSSENTETDVNLLLSEVEQKFILEKKITIIKNKIDKIGAVADCYQQGDHTVIQLSAKYDQGIELLRSHLKKQGAMDIHQEGLFIARRRHLEALSKAKIILESALTQFVNSHAGELLAEDLRQAQYYLNTITGEFTTDDLLGEIFSSFCIGK